MGGVGSTRWQGYVKKQVAEDCYVITIVGPRPEPLLRGPLPEDQHWRAVADDLALEWQVLVEPCGYQGAATLTGPEIEAVTVPLVATRPHKRGLHWYWLCPACGRRVAKLYLPPGSRCFRCRHCHDLTYRSSQRHDRAMDRFYQMGPDELEEATRSEDPRIRERAQLVMSTRRILVLRDGSRFFY